MEIQIIAYAESIYPLGDKTTWKLPSEVANVKIVSPTMKRRVEKQKTESIKLTSKKRIKRYKRHKKMARR